MAFYVSPKTSFRILEFVGKRMGFLTLSSSKSLREEIIKFDYVFWFCVINLILLLLPTFYGLHENRENFFAASYSWMEISAYFEAMATLIISKSFKTHYESLILIPEELLNGKIPKVVRRYASFYAILYSTMIVFYTAAVVVYFVIDRPGMQDKMIITTAIYPFEIKSWFLKFFLYFNQFFVISFTVIIPYYDGMVIFLIFMCTYRLKLLEHHYSKSKTKEDLKNCIREHSDVLCIVKNTNYAVRYMVLRIILSFISNVFASGLQILNKAPRSETIHLYVILVLALARIYVIAESAENMTSVSKEIPHTIYATDWYYESTEIISMKAMIICRCQNFPVISVGGIKAILNRKYLKAIISTTMSYLMTLKTITNHASRYEKQNIWI